MKIYSIPCLQDNYAYLLVCERTGMGAVVDPSDAGPVVREVRRLGCDLKAIWNTHHHWDHVGGNEALCQTFANLQVLGYVKDAQRQRIPRQTQSLEHEEVFSMGEMRVRVLYNPGHTLGAISYVVNEAHAFTGDTLFGAGCGRVFEGDAAMMHASLNEVLGQLQGNCLAYFGHEYTQNNLRFAQAVEPQNDAIVQRIQQVNAKRQQGQPTTPATMAEERASNPFLRCSQPEVIHAALAHGATQKSSVAVFAALRAWKDSF